MLLDARPYREKKIMDLQKRVYDLGEQPRLALIRIGEDPASEKYVNNKVKLCKEVGVISEVIHFEEDVKLKEVEEMIDKLNKDGQVTGILLQLPLPKHLDESYLTSLIDYKKDVDGFTATNIGKLTLGMDSNIACTPKGIIDLLKQNKIELEGKDVLIINRSNIVGKPLAMLMLKENATVTIAHSRTKDLKKKIFNYDIVVTAIGKPSFFDWTDFKDNTTIVDVSINFDENGKMCGDVSKDSYLNLISKDCNITPVPNGVGICTVVALIEQVIEMKEREVFW